MARLEERRGRYLILFRYHCKQRSLPHDRVSHDKAKGKPAQSIAC